MNRLGQVTKVYDLGNYKLHHDYVFDENGNMLILATDTTQDSVEDIVLKLDVNSGEVTEVLDLGDLFGEYKKTCVKNSSDEMCIRDREYLAVEFDAPLAGIWSPPKKQAPFVCIEPWYGRCDSERFDGELKDRDWENALEAGGEFEASYKIIIE